ncbi:ParB/RepB/Spo0J family partition protein [Vagococcus vulneris]|uniref:Chromosome partitioning protein ParB n=1 Tax=Vagococcus vulneris TaxID=1977869 RepID=A0A429ZS77_9ENTE|nr:ParB/RepB/Spo0J family partition protein [Vagococcus vulneris]RST96572.1 chromosome partitioning protein ParB [Vagococcus vulneris]
MNKNSLGRGINALFEDISSIEEDVKLEEVMKLPLTELRPNPYQPRKVFDDKALTELADSIKQSGVFQPIIVRKSSIKGYEIIAGERRFRASKIAGQETIPAIVREFDEAQMMQIAVLENLQREDLSPMEEAEAYDMLMKNLKLTQNDLASQLGKSRSYIANYLRLLSLPAVVRDLVQNESLSMGQARTLLGLKDEKAIIPLANRVLKEGLTVRQLEQIVSEMNNEQPALMKKTKKKMTKKPYYVTAGEDLLMDKFGTSVAIQDKEGKGKIEIEYLSPDDLTRILDILEIQLDD